MSLTQSLNSLVQGLNVTQKQIALSSTNIANVNTPGYARISANQSTLVAGGVGVGVEIASYSAEIDTQLSLQIRDSVSTLQSNTVLNDYYDNILKLYGSPGAPSNLGAILEKFFQRAQSLSDSPNNSTAQINFVNGAQDIAQKISSIADGLNDLRFQADREIAQSANEINAILERLEVGNEVVPSLAEGSEQRVTFERQRDNDLRALSEYLDISTYEDANGKLFISSGGASLLDTNRQQVSYIPASSASTFEQNGALNGFIVSAVDDQGSPAGSTVELISSGNNNEISTTVNDGKLYALSQLRDVEIPKLIDQLNNFASTFTDQVNNSYNNYSSFPPETEFTGQEALNLNTEISGNGNVRIALLNQDGTAVNSPFPGEASVKPLDIDLGNLSSSLGQGRPTVQTIIDEINSYYGPRQDRASVGNIENINLTAISNDISIGGAAQFDLEIDNISNQNATIVIQSATLIDPIDGSSDYAPVVLPSDNNAISEAGIRARTDQAITVNFSGDDSRSEYLLRVRVQVTSEDGSVSEADIDYTVRDDVTNIINDRYSPIDVTNVSGSSSLVTSPTNASYINAQLVNDAGQPVTDPNQAGYLQISTSSANYGIVIDGTSSNLDIANQSDTTDSNFGQFFGLNNLFTGNDAASLSVRTDIVSTPSKLATAGLTPVINNDENNPNYAVELSNGNNEGAIELAALADRLVSFDATSSFASITSTFSSYAGDIISFAATEKNNYENLVSLYQTNFDGLRQSFQEISGVDTDKELANIIELETQFKVMSQTLSVVRDLMNELTSILD